MAALQEGIYHAPGMRPGRHLALLFLRVRDGVGAPGAGAALAGLWSMYEGLKAGRVRDLDGVALPADQDRMSVLLGIGRNAFELTGAALARPRGLADEYLFRSAAPDGGGPLLRGSGLRYAPDVRANMATEAFCVQVIAETKLAVDRAVVETWKALADADEPALELTTFYLGNQRNDHRSWIDFHDGLSNLRSEDRESVIAIGPGTDEGWAVGGTYLAFLRLAVDLAGWRRLERRDQELAVGRDKLTGCPIAGVDGEGLSTDPGCPVAGTQIFETPNDGPFAEPPEVTDPLLRASHVQRANHHLRPASDSGSRRIFRQGYEFLEWAGEAPGFRAGLNFVSFQDTPARLLKMLTAGGWLGGTNFGGDEDAHPELASLLSVYAAGVYFVAPVVEGEPFPGAAALGVVGAGGAGLAPMPAAPAFFEASSRPPDARLRGIVASYTGYAELAAAPVRRLEVPFAGIPLILSLGPTLLVDGVRHRSFAAGLDDRATVTEYTGEQRGIQVDLTPLGARRLLGLPMAELARRVVPLEDLLGGERLVERLEEASDWPARFAVLDAFMLRRLAQAAPVVPQLEHAWERLRCSDGAVEIATLAEEVGWSRRHLAARFGAEVGLPPKTVARVLRFERVTRTLRASGGQGLADIAYACGYADQAHLNRDFRAFAGTTPTDFAARLLPGGAGVAADDLPNVQDALARAA